jgi:cytochrome bd-type quinol oxidase subunit 2
MGGPLALLPALVLAALFATHGLAFAALRLRGTLRERAAVLSGGAGEVRTLALTATAMAVVGVLAGLRLPLEPGTSGALLVPVILVMMPLLVASQAWVWWTFRHRVNGPSYL